MAPRNELACERHDINVLEKAEAERVIDFIERANCRVREALFKTLSQCRGAMLW